jgi:hypothetical protein
MSLRVRNQAKAPAQAMADPRFNWLCAKCTQTSKCDWPVQFSAARYRIVHGQIVFS